MDSQKRITYYVLRDRRIPTGQTVHVPQARAFIVNPDSVDMMRTRLGESFSVEEIVNRSAKRNVYRCVRPKGALPWDPKAAEVVSK